MRRWFAAALALVVLTPAAHAGKLIVPHPSPTWREEAANSKIMLYGRLENARQDKDGGRTDFVIEHVLKTDPALGNTKRVTIPRYVDLGNGKEPVRILVFVDVFKGELDVYRGIMVGPAAVEYVKGLLALKDRPRDAQLRYYFDHLEHAEKEIAEDAFAEFVREPDAVLAKAACNARPEALRGWLRNEKTPKPRAALYAMLLGHSGDPEDAALVRALLEKTGKEGPNQDSLFKAYVLLKPAEAWPHAHAVAKDAAEPFIRRYAVLRAARYFLAEQRGVVPRKALLDTFAVLLEQRDIADLAVEYLRQAGCWDLTDRVLALSTKKSQEVPVIRRAVLRYALQCPGPVAARYVTEVQKADPQLVQDTLELLELEAATPPNKP
jgi:hypothetical protein